MLDVPLFLSVEKRNVVMFYKYTRIKWWMMLIKWIHTSTEYPFTWLSYYLEASKIVHKRRRRKRRVTIFQEIELGVRLKGGGIKSGARFTWCAAIKMITHFRTSSSPYVKIAPKIEKFLNFFKCSCLEKKKLQFR